MTTPDETPATEAARRVEPLGAEAEFAAEVNELVADCAPQLFALVGEEGERVDGCILAWGLAFDDHVDVVGDAITINGSFRSAEIAHQAFSCLGKTRLVWLDPDAATPPGQAA
ncbi:MAG: hypothetical protein ACRDTF_14405 [Pseudonocardiaceae bacterium]